MRTKYQEKAKTPKERVYVYLNEEEKQLLFEQAVENGQSVSAYVSELVRNAFDKIIRLPLDFKNKHQSRE